MSMNVGDKVRILGQGGPFEGWYGTISGEELGFFRVNLIHDAACQAKPIYEIEGVSPNDLILD